MARKNKIGLDAATVAVAALLIALASVMTPRALLVGMSAELASDPAAQLGVLVFRYALLGLVPLVFFAKAVDAGHLAGARRCILFLALMVRCVSLNAPYADFHSHRQTETASIARNFLEKSPNILYPLVNRQADAGNVVESEFQLVPWIAAGGYRLFGEHPWIGRATVVLFAVLAVFAGERLFRIWFGDLVALFASVFLALCPMAIYFGRTLMPDTPSLALITLGLWRMSLWAERSKYTRGPWLGTMAIALGLMVKISSAYVYLPLLWLVHRRLVTLRGQRGRGVQSADLFQCLYVLIAPLLAAAAWYGWSHCTRDLTFGIWGDGFSKWSTADLIADGSFWGLIGSRVFDEILTPVGTLCSLVGLTALIRARTHGAPLVAFWLTSLIVFVAATAVGNKIHSYYQLPFVMAFAPLVGSGLSEMWGWGTIASGRELSMPWQKWRGRTVTLLAIVALALFSSRRLPRQYQLKQDLLRAADAIGRNLPPAARVLVISCFSDPSMLYYLHRPGWVEAAGQALRADSALSRYIEHGARLVLLQGLGQCSERWPGPASWEQALHKLPRQGELEVLGVPERATQSQ